MFVNYHRLELTLALQTDASLDPHASEASTPDVSSQGAQTRAAGAPQASVPTPSSQAQGTTATRRRKSKKDKEKEKPFLGDRVLANAMNFMHDAFVVREFLYAVAEGDAGRVYEAMKVCSVHALLC